MGNSSIDNEPKSYELSERVVKHFSPLLRALLLVLSLSIAAETQIRFGVGTNQQKATPEITGDFVLLATEVNPVIRALRENGIAVTALHSHMLSESPRLFFMHFWANDDALKLARGLRTVLDKTNAAPN